MTAAITKRYRSIIFLLVLSLPVSAQFSDSLFKRYTVSDGLSNNYITSIQQDDMGYLWMGTEMGLNRFDGTTFKNLLKEPGIEHAPGAIFQIRKFNGNEMAILSKDGLQLLNSKDVRFSRYDIIGDSTAFSSYLNACWDACFLPGGSIALTTATGFYVFDKNRKIKFRHDAFTSVDIGNRMLYGRDIIQINGNELLVYIHNDGLAHYDIKKEVFREIDKNDKQWEIFRMVTADTGFIHLVPCKISANEYLFIYFGNDGIAYYNQETKDLVKTRLPDALQKQFTWESHIVAINDTSFVLNGSHGGFFAFTLDKKTGKLHFDTVKHLADYAINILFVDKEGRLWAGTRNGLLRQKLHRNFLKAVYYQPEEDDKAVIGFQSGYRHKDKLFVSRFSRTNGLVVIDTATGKVIKRMAFFGKNNAWNEISSMIMYHPDTLWLGTGSGPVWMDVNNYHYGKIFDPSIYPLIPEGLVHFSPVNKDGNAWFLFFMEGMICRYNIASRKFTFITPHDNPVLPFYRVKHIVYDAYGDIWVGGHSLARFSSKLNKFDTVMSVYEGERKFNDNILALSADNNGSLWLHNAENALVEYKIREKRFVAYTTKDGLPSNIVQFLSPVVNNILWIGDPNHLTKFNLNSKQTVVYDYNDGFPDETMAIRKSYYDTATASMYFFCRDYIVRFSTNSIPDISKAIQPVVQEMRINEKKIIYHPETGLRLKHNENNIDLRFSIIEYEFSGSIRLSYKIDKDRNWNYAGASQSVRLSELNSGKHTIIIRSTDKNGEEKITEFSFYISTPFWKTPAFLIAIFLLLTVLLYYLYRRRLHGIHQRANIDKQIAQTQMKALHAQMNPHFIFNSLNSIREMILNNENKEASHFLSKFAQLMRMTLDHSAHNFISLRSTNEYLERYIEMEQIRNDHFTCSIVTDEDLDPDETLLPPMLIQPFIENAIWHGTTGPKKEISINIDFKKEGEQLVCIIDDNGIGIRQSMENKIKNDESHSSIGISNIRNRIQLMNEKYGLESNIDIIDKSILPGKQQGTRVTIRLPLHINE